MPRRRVRRPSLDAAAARRSPPPSPRPKAAVSCYKTTTGCACRPPNRPRRRPGLWWFKTATGGCFEEGRLSGSTCRLPTTIMRSRIPSGGRDTWRRHHLLAIQFGERTTRRNEALFKASTMSGVNSVPDAQPAQSSGDNAAIDPVPIADHVARSPIPGKCLRYLTCHPFRRWFCCDADPGEFSRSSRTTTKA